MHALSIAMAVLAALLLAIALLVPLRDDRRGRRATLFGATPFRAVFPIARGDEPALAVAAHIEPRKNAFSALAFRTFGTTFGTRKRAIDDEHAADADGPAAEHTEAYDGSGDAEPSIAVLHDDGDADDDEPARANADERGDESDAGRAFAAELAWAQTRTTGTSSDVAGGLPSACASEDARPSSVDVAPTPAREVRASGGDDIVVRSTDVGHFDRSRPPLTRLPLRPVRPDVVWARALPGGENWSRDERRQFLRACAERPDPSCVPALRAAWSEEDATGRLLALAALAKSSDDARETFVDALRTGSDDERAFVVDVFADRGDRAALASALSDRLDAIAARAALALVGNGSRADFRAALEPLVDRARLDAILALLTAVFA